MIFLLIMNLFKMLDCSLVVLARLVKKDDWNGVIPICKGHYNVSESILVDVSYSRTVEDVVIVTREGDLEGGRH
jgi:hypothetical protein